MALRTLPVQGDGGQVWSLRDRDTVIASFFSLAAGAAQSIFAALWDEELVELKPVLEDAARRGGSVHVAIYGTTQLTGPSSYDLTLCGQSAVERLAGRRLSIIVADRRLSIVAEFYPDGSVEAVSTDNSVIGLLAIEYVKADVLGRLLIDEMGEVRFDQLRQEPSAIERLLRA
jgi:hypothetical protein